MTNSFLLPRNVALACGVLVILFINTAKAHNLPANKKFLAVYAFGDSIFDTGNNNALKGFTLLKANFPPYGRQFKDQKATGRFSNGKLIPDLMAEAFGIKEFLPSYKESASLDSKDFQTGICFASAGSGYDPLTSTILQVYSEQKELKFFDDYLVKLKSQVGEQTSKTILDNSLFIVSSGNNDILISYFASRVRKFQYDVPSYAAFLTKLASTFVKGLYERGARKIGVTTVGPLGCTPIAKTMQLDFDSDGCVEVINDAVKIFNSKLASEIASLNKQLPGAKIILVDTYSSAIDLIKNSAKLGFKVTNKGCCSSGTLETGLLCNRFSMTCSNVTEYLFFDSIHPTEAAYRVLFNDAFKQLVF